jgi:hypothetical protein
MAHGGVQLEFVSSEAFLGKDEREKIRMIMDAVKKDKILVLEGAISPDEQKWLIAATMEAVTKDFSGVEIATIGDDVPSTSAFGAIRTGLLKALGGKPSGITVIGPANLVKQVRKDPTRLNVLAKG